MKLTDIKTLQFEAIACLKNGKEVSVTVTAAIEEGYFHDSCFLIREVTPHTEEEY